MNDGGRELRLARWLDELFQDVRFSLRQMHRNPSFTTVTVLTLAVGIGTTTAMFSVVESVLLRPLRYDPEQRLVKLWERAVSELEPDWVSPANFLDWKAQSQSFSGMAAYATETAALVDRGGPEQVSVASVSSDFFSLLEVRPLFGRTFLPEEDQPSRDNVAIISHGLWQRRFGGDAALLDRVVHEECRVIGILPPDFEFPQGAQVWLPLALRDAQRLNRQAHFLEVVARLDPDVTFCPR